MPKENNPSPAIYKGVMVSSTFKDLEQHRTAVIGAIEGNNLKSVVMEHDSAKPDGDVIDSSLQMVRDSSAYVAIISHKYGQIPVCAERNPDQLSLTELEFKEACRINRPVLLFIMGDNHDVKPGDVETDPEKIEKLKAFRKSAKPAKPDSSVHRVYNVFNDLSEFEVAARNFIAELCRYFDKQDEHAARIAERTQLTKVMSQTFDVFLSYNTKNKPIIRELAEALVARGLTPWLDVDQIAPGAIFQDELENGMNNSRAAIAAYGEQGSGPWQTEEVRILLQHSVSSGKPVIPVILPGAPDKPRLPAFLAQRNWLDLTNGLTSANIEKLIWGIKGKKPPILAPQGGPTPPQDTDPLTPIPPTGTTEIDPIPTPPAFYAEPSYIGSHKFLGRKAQLDILNDWATPAESHPILLFEAIGGAGKSILTWDWVIHHATGIREDWAGRFWYSFYERGAVMADFCRRALAYITGQPLENFKKKKTPELGDMLLRQLQTKPWLIVFDGLERILVAYHRYDAAQITDEEAGEATDQIAKRDPCAAIRPEDDELLRILAAAAPSKLLLTSRLIPQVLLNAANQPIPGVLRERLPGLRPPDAEALLRACGVTGDSKNTQSYLQKHCDCHPLVIGVLAGLITDYLPNKGNFDAWAADPNGGGQLNLADLNLTQKRNHILKAALAALPEKSSQLLSTLALLSEAVDYTTLNAFNPHLPPEPEEVKEPRQPEKGYGWKRMSDDEKAEAKKYYQADLQRRKDYEQALKVRTESPEFLTAPKKLQETVRDLERRGLLQYDPQSKRHDLHPVVRGIASGGLVQKDKELYGQRVVDHFSQQSHSSYDEAETLKDVRNGLNIVRTLLQMGCYLQACGVYRGDLARALYFNLEANAEILSLLRPFFPNGWGTLPKSLDADDGAYLANSAAITLSENGEYKEAFAAYSTALRVYLNQENWGALRTILSNISIDLVRENRLAEGECCSLLALDISYLRDIKEDIFIAMLLNFGVLAQIGKWKDAEKMWQLLDPMGRDWPRINYRPGDAEFSRALFNFWQSELKAEHLDNVEQLAEAGKSRIKIRRLHSLRGEWHLDQGQYAPAMDSLHEAVRMAREVGLIDAKAETLLAFARFHLGQLSDPRQEAERLAKAKNVSDRELAELWFAIDDREKAKKPALAAYEWAWADGEPYVNRYELNKARDLLEQLGVDIPDLPPYDPDKDEKFPWEDDVISAIEKLRAEKEAKKAAEESKKK